MACVSRPRGPRPTGPPILVASFGPRMLKLTARFADAWNTAWLATPEPLAQRRAGLEEACRAEGRDPAEIEITVGVNVAYPDLSPEPSEDEADKVLSRGPPRRSPPGCGRSRTRASGTHLRGGRRSRKRSTVRRGAGSLPSRMTGTSWTGAGWLGCRRSSEGTKPGS
jgi:alkanesulfonate monooxygenase SsuD/methylene tetrahydromethanopterin reductase-like flavin-dependent oxidoreductase (luciferase family)